MKKVLLKIIAFSVVHKKFTRKPLKLTTYFAELCEGGWEGCIIERSSSTTEYTAVGEIRPPGLRRGCE